MPSRHLYILRLQGPDKQNCLPSSMTPKGKNGSGKSHTNIPALVRDPVPASKGPAMIDMVDIPDILKAFKVSTQAEAKVRFMISSRSMIKYSRTMCAACQAVLLEVLKAYTADDNIKLQMRWYILMITQTTDWLRHAIPDSAPCYILSAV